MAGSTVADSAVQLGAMLAAQRVALRGARSADYSVVSWAAQRVVPWAAQKVEHSVAQMVGASVGCWAASLAGCLAELKVAPTVVTMAVHLVAWLALQTAARTVDWKAELKAAY